MYLHQFEHIAEMNVEKSLFKIEPLMAIVENIAYFKIFLKVEIDKDGREIGKPYYYNAHFINGDVVKITVNSFILLLNNIKNMKTKPNIIMP